MSTIAARLGGATLLILAFWLALDPGDVLQSIATRANIPASFLVFSAISLVILGLAVLARTFLQEPDDGFPTTTDDWARRRGLGYSSSRDIQIKGPQLGPIVHLTRLFGTPVYFAASLHARAMHTRFVNAWHDNVHLDVSIDELRAFCSDSAGRARQAQVLVHLRRNDFLTLTYEALRDALQYLHSLDAEVYIAISDGRYGHRDETAFVALDAVFDDNGAAHIDNLLEILQGDRAIGSYSDVFGRRLLTTTVDFDAETGNVLSKLGRLSWRDAVSETDDVQFLLVDPDSGLPLMVTSLRQLLALIDLDADDSNGNGGILTA